MSGDGDCRAPILITGFPRSGTTLLRSLLGQHSEVELANEPELIYALHRAGYGMDSRFPPGDRERDLDRLRGNLLTRQHLDRLSPEILESFVERDGEIGVRELYEHLLPRPEGIRAWGEKSLSNLFYVSELCGLYPDALVITVIRDPRAAILSKLVKLRAKGEGRDTTDYGPGDCVPREDWSVCARQAMAWSEWARRARLLEGEELSGRLLVVRFEDLVGDPEGVIGSLCREAGLEPEAGMADPRQRAGDAVLDTRGGYAHRKVGEAVDASRAESFSGMHPVLTWIVERYAGGEMRARGYAPSGVRPSLPDRLRYRARLLKNRRRLNAALRDHIEERRPGGAS